MNIHVVAAILLPIAIQAAVVDANSNGFVEFTVTDNDAKIFRDCKSKIGVAEDEAIEILNNHEKNANDNVKCFNACLYKSYNVIKDNGMVDPEAAIKYFKVEQLEGDKKIVTQCSDERNLNKEKSDCDTAQAMESCYYEMKKKGH